MGPWDAWFRLLSSQHGTGANDEAEKKQPERRNEKSNNAYSVVSNQPMSLTETEQMKSHHRRKQVVALNCRRPVTNAVDESFFLQHRGFKDVITKHYSLITRSEERYFSTFTGQIRNGGFAAVVLGL